MVCEYIIRGSGHHGIDRTILNRRRFAQTWGNKCGFVRGPDPRCGYLVFLVWFEFAATALASTPFGDRCAEFGDPASCNIVSTINLIELLFWPAILVPAFTFVGLVLALRHRVGNPITWWNPSIIDPL